MEATWRAGWAHPGQWGRGAALCSQLALGERGCPVSSSSRVASAAATGCPTTHPHCRNRRRKPSTAKQRSVSVGCPGRRCFPLLLPGLQLSCHHRVSPWHLEKKTNHSTSCRLAAWLLLWGKIAKDVFFKVGQIACVKSSSTQFMLQLCTVGLCAHLQTVPACTVSVV